MTQTDETADPDAGPDLAGRLDDPEPIHPTRAFADSVEPVPAYAPPVRETDSAERYAASPAPTTTVDPGHRPDHDRGEAVVETAEPRTVRMRTVVLGLVLLVIAGAVLVGQLTDVTVNAGAVLLALMIGGGVLLIAGARRS